MTTILKAGYGVWNQTVDVTGVIQSLYNSGQRVFTAPPPNAGDPSHGNRKYLYAFWESNGRTYSGVVGENDSGFTIE